MTDRVRARVMPPLLRTLKACWKALPLQYRVLAKQEPDVVALDYPGHPLQLLVSSDADADRAGACAKEPGTVRWLEEEVRGVLFDIGANVGAYSLIAAAHSRGNTRVFAFEPGFSTFPQLCRNILLNGLSSIVPLNIALSDQSELREFRYGRLESGAAAHLGLSDAAGASQQNRPAVVFAQPMWVYSLDDAIEKFRLPWPNHVKLDVDGHELAILRGARTTLSHPALRSIQVEIGALDSDGPAIRALLADHGFAIARVAQHASGPIADYVFTRGTALEPSVNSQEA